MNLNNKTVEKLIKEGEYEYLQEILNEYFSDPNATNRLYFNILRMIEHMAYLGKLDYYGRPKINYESDVEHCLNRFYEAMKFRDYEEAYNMTFECINFLSKKMKPTYEMYMYQLVLKDVVDLQNEKIEELSNKNSIKNDLKKLSEINKTYINLEISQIPEIKEIIENLIQNSYNSSFDCTQYIYISEIISMIELVKNYKYIDKSYFCNLKKEFEIVPTFYELLSNGDYIRCYEYLSRKEKRDKIIEENGYLFTKLLFKLLKLLNELIQKNQKSNFLGKHLSEKVRESLVLDNYEIALSDYLNSNISKNEEVISKLLILNKYSK